MDILGIFNVGSCLYKQTVPLLLLHWKGFIFEVCTRQLPSLVMSWNLLGERVYQYAAGSE